MAAGRMLGTTQRIETDVLIIGGGAAGMIAAIGALRAGAKPLVVTKGTCACGSSSMARGGYCIAIAHVDPEDNPQYFLENAITASFGSANLPREIVLKLHGELRPNAAQAIEIGAPN